MTLEKSNYYRLKIQQVGWGHEHTDEIIEYLKMFREESQKHLLTDSLDQYAKANGRSVGDYETQQIQSYCSYYMDTNVRKDLCLLTIGSQMVNKGYEAVVELGYQIDETSVTLKGLAVKLK